MINLKRILLPTDLSECAQHARSYAIDLAAKFGAELHLLHVIHDPATDVPDFGMGLAFPAYTENLPEKRRELTASVTQSLQTLLADCPAQVKTSISVQFGPPFLKILNYVEEHDIDLIVMGTHGRTGVMHVLLGSVAERVIQNAVCPVLTVRLQPDAKDDLN